MSFGIGGGGATTDPSFGYGEQFSSGAGGGSSQGQSTAQVFPDKVWPTQARYLEQLYAQGSNQLAQGAPGGVQELMQQGQGAAQSLLNPGMNPLLDIYQQDVQQNLQESLLPAIRRDAQGAGQFGGGRQQVAEGIVTRGANRDITNMASSLYSQDRQNQLGALGQVPALANLGLGAPWYGLNQFAGLLGSPTVLDQGSYSQNTNSSNSFSSQSGYGYDSSQGGGTRPGTEWYLGV